jgi:class 3 adenylate cyclase
VPNFFANPQAPENVMRLSAAVNFAWQIAADEATRLQHEQIDPPDLLLGVCSVGKLFAPGVRDSLGAGAVELSEASVEWNRLAPMLRSVEVPLSDLRRKIRSQLVRHADPAPRPEKISRSEATIQVFKLAEDIARAKGSPAVDLIDILGALLHSDEVLRVLAAAGVSSDKFRASYDAASSACLAVSETALGQGTGEPIVHSLQIPAAEALVTESLDATAPVFAAIRGTTGDRRLAMFSELSWQLGSESVDVLLQSALERLMAAIPAAKRGAILVRSTTEQMLLKAHVPPGGPAVSLTLVERAMSTRAGFIWQRSEDATRSQVESRSESGIYAPLVWNGESYGAICVDNSDTVTAFVSDDLKLVVALAHQLALIIANDELTSKLRRNANLMERLLTNFSPKTRSLLLAKAEQGKLRLGGERSEVTLLCSDIRGFTKIASGMDADDVVDMLNDYLSVLVGCIFRNGGTVDKFIGDAILAVFGSPEPDPNQHVNGLTAAIAMQEAIRALNLKRAERGEIVCEIGIGLHCGPVLHGFIGTNERMEFTVIGDVVNKTSRFCTAAQAGEIVVSPDLHQHVWKVAPAEAITIPTKHEGMLAAYRVQALSKTARPHAGL